MRAVLALTAAFALVATGLVTAAPPAEAFDTSRIAGADRFATSVEISRQSPATGDVVFLTNGMKFPDALAAGPVAAAEDGHLLLTLRDTLPEVVAERIRVLAPSEIVVVGSAASISDAVATRAIAAARTAGGGQTLTRIDGVDRVDTSLQLLDRLRETGDIGSIWIASGANFPDALAAASVAGRDRSAVVLDYHGADTAATQAWLDRVGSHVDGLPVNIAGDTPSVSAADEEGLDRYAAAVNRHAGADRYETARLINERFPSASPEPTMLLATGQNFPDALGGAVYAAISGAPLFLTPNACHSTITPMLKAEAERRGIEHVVGFGSDASISNAALAMLPCPSFTPLQEEMGERFGTFEPMTFSGDEFFDGRLDLGRDFQFALIRATLPTDGMLDIIGYGPEEGDPPYTLVRDFGKRPADGMHTVDILIAQPQSNNLQYLWTQISGPWTITVMDLRNVPELPEHVSSTHGAVFLKPAGRMDYTFTHRGDWDVEMRELITYDSWDHSNYPRVQERGPLTVTGDFRTESTVISVEATADWSLEVRRP